MKIIRTWTDEFESGDSHVYSLCDNAEGNTVTGEMYIQSDEDAGFSAEVSVDGENFLASKMVRMDTYEKVDAAEEAGVYLIACAGYAKVKISATDDCTLFCKTTY